MIKSVVVYILLIISVGCATSSDESLDSESATGAEAETKFSVDEKRTYAEISEPHDPVDTIYEAGRHIILLKVQSYSLNDSALVNSRRDTIENHIVIRENYNHNARIDFKLIDGDSTWRFSLDKMAFADVLGPELVKASNAPKVKIRCIDPARSHVILGVCFCFPTTQACADGFALIDYRRSELEFVAEHGVDCGSSVEVVGDKILTCAGLYDFEGNKVLKFKDYVVLAEPLDSRTILMVEARYNEERLNAPGASESLLEEKDTISDNAFVYNLEGELLYSFAYHGWNDESKYSAPVVKTGPCGRLYLFDFNRKKYYIPGKEYVKEHELSVLGYTPAGYNEYKVYNDGRKEAVVLNDTNRKAYWKP